MKKIIEVKDLCKTYKMGEFDIEVLKNITLSFDKGNFASIMGPSGSGKSTLLYLLGGLDSPTSGSIKISGVELSAMDDKAQSIMRRRNVGFIFQFYNLIPNLTVEENAMLPLLLDGKNVNEYKDLLANILEMVGLSNRRNHTPRELSGGQQQRVAIARALMNNPDIILADEPTGNLDSKTGTDIMKLLQRINMENEKTIIQVTHSREAAEYGDRIINLRDGEVL